jgi:hypothetical protein
MPAVRLAALTLAVAAAVVVLALVGLASGERHTTPASRRAAPIPSFVGVRFDSRLDGDEGQPGGRRPDADDR